MRYGQGALAEELSKLVGQGKLVVQQNEQPLTDPTAIRDVLAESLEQMHAAIDFCFLRYVSETDGAWADHVDREGVIFTDAMPATTGYHVFLALSEAIRILEK